jgi:hypothetical protein
MFQMAPEDRLREVLHYQEEQRRQAALERMARAAPAGPQRRPGRGAPRNSGWSNPWLAARQLLHSISGTHGA